ncbi:calcium-binding protein, partial [Teichococcus deserti]|uniref:calcium-binding protein n=1 Tax=Teichococcus deserti TaxID=1817963 RepID=UPI003462CE75
GNDYLYGDIGRDTLRGGAGNDRLDGAAGADLMDGGAGNDTYLIDDVADRVAELADEGIDILSVKLITAYTMAANTETMIFTGATAFAATGNDTDNSITGGAGDDTLSGRGGDDLLRGGAGQDRLIGGDGQDRLLGEAGDDGLQGGDAADILSGGEGNDRLDGGAGDDILQGGRGDDLAYGGAGKDTFTFLRQGGGPNLHTYHLTIADFAAGEDTILLPLPANRQKELRITEDDKGTTITWPDADGGAWIITVLDHTAAELKFGVDLIWK